MRQTAPTTRAARTPSTIASAPSTPPNRRGRSSAAPASTRASDARRSASTRQAQRATGAAPIGAARGPVMNSTATFLPAGSVTASGPADAARQTRTYLDTPIGWIRLLAIDGVVTELSATEPHEARCPPTGPPLHPATFKQVVSELRAYFAGRLRRFTSPIALRATSFEERVWREVLRISYGETRSYRDIAIAIGQPDAVRAVGAANGRNPIAIIVPCHRVIGSDRRLTGYSGGLDRKQSLLDLEGATGWRRSSSAASAPATRTK